MFLTLTKIYICLAFCFMTDGDGPLCKKESEKIFDRLKDVYSPGPAQAPFVVTTSVVSACISI